MGKLLVLDLATMKFKIISHGKNNSAQEMKKYVILDKFLDPKATGIDFNDSLYSRAYVNNRKIPFGSQVIIRNLMKFLSQQKYEYREKQSNEQIRTRMYMDYFLYCWRVKLIISSDDRH